MAALRSLGPPMATGSWSADCWLGSVTGVGGRSAWLLAAGREIDPVMSFFAPSIGGANSDGIACVVWFKPSGGVVAIAGPDRKSTRLNSSHLGISYAVFCLR